MTTIRLHITSILCCVLIFSCDGSFFTSSFYNGLDPYVTPSSNDLGNIKSILALSSDDKFYEHLKENPAEAEKAIQTLKEAVEEIKVKQAKKDAGTATTEDAINADDTATLLTLANVEYATSGSEKILENMNTLSSDLVSSDLSKFDTLTALIKKLITVDETASEEEKNADVTKQIESLMELADIYALYEDINTDENGEFTPVDDEENVKEKVATKALTAGLVKYIVENLNTVPQEIKEKNPGLDENNEDDLKELKKAAVIDAIVNDKEFPDYTLPAGVDSSASLEEKTQAMMKEVGISEVVNAGLDLNNLLSTVGEEGEE